MCVHGDLLKNTYDLLRQQHADATVIFISSQIEMILKFFLSRNLRIARERAWDQTLKSRGKEPEFWGPYVEEWQAPPQVREGGKQWHDWISSGFSRYIITRGDIFLFVYIGPYSDNLT